MAETNGAADQKKAEELAKEAAQELQQLRRELRKRAEDVRKETVKQLNKAAETIRKEAHEATIQDEFKTSADDIARGLEKAASYLNSRTVDDMGEDASRVVRKNPLRAVIISLIVGVLLGMMMRGDKD
jgi:F0F1-type ATP synthase membrane subunit b/b'